MCERRVSSQRKEVHIRMQSSEANACEGQWGDEFLADFVSSSRKLQWKNELIAPQGKISC